jgi:predicted ATP-dependent endonuclease of OLD family
MLEQLEIRNYRSCVSTSIKLQPDLSVLIGPNGTGKTNLLHAILLLRKLAEEQDEFSLHRSSEDLSDETHLRAVFRVDGKAATIKLDVQLDTDEGNADVIRRSKQVWSMRDFTGTNKQFRIPLGYIAPLFRSLHPRRVTTNVRNYLFHYVRDPEPIDVPDSIVKPLIAIAEHLSNIKYYSASQFTNPSQCPVSFEIEKEGTFSRGRRLGGHAKFLYDLYTSSRNPIESGYQQFFDVIGPRGIGLISNIDFKELPTSSIDYSVQSGGKVRQRKREKSLIVPQFMIGRNELSPNQLSEGTFKTITLLFYLMTEKSSGLLIEEPEVCVHHGLLSSIVELIKTYSKQKQIVLSTHSDFVLDKIEPHHVYKVVRDNETGTQVSHITEKMSEKELGALKDYLEQEGNLGEYWKHGGLEEVG